jgi:hypothetical protein
MDFCLIDRHLFVANGILEGGRFEFSQDYPLGESRIFFVIYGEKLLQLERVCEVCIRAGLLLDYKKWDTRADRHFYRLTHGTKPSSVLQILENLGLWPLVTRFVPDPDH